MPSWEAEEPGSCIGVRVSGRSRCSHEAGKQLYGRKGESTDHPRMYAQAFWSVSASQKKRGGGGEGRGGKKYTLVIVSSKDWAATGLMFYK